MDTNTTEPVTAEIGTVTTINVARPGEPVQLRYYGAARSGATGQAHATRAQAEADVKAWHEGRSPDYVKHAEMPAGYTARLAAGVRAQRPGIWGKLKASFSF